MDNSILLHNIEPEGLKTLIAEAVSKALTAAKPKPQDNYLTRFEVASKLHVSLPTVDKYIRDGKVKAVRVGRRLLFLESELNFPEVQTRKRHA
jgi:excisionase family DNA binding protein